jgi:hypothetical protein
VVPESQNAKTAACKIPSALEVLEQSFCVLPTVQFDDQSRSKAHEIHDVVSHRHLSAEAIPTQLPVAHETPEAPFGVTGIPAQCACG